VQASHVVRKSDFSARPNYYSKPVLHRRELFKLLIETPFSGTGPAIRTYQRSDYFLFADDAPELIQVETAQKQRQAADYGKAVAEFLRRRYSRICCGRSLHLLHLSKIDSKLLAFLV
jgi:hypothetical protein